MIFNVMLGILPPPVKVSVPFIYQLTRLKMISGVLPEVTVPATFSSFPRSSATAFWARPCHDVLGVRLSFQLVEVETRLGEDGLVAVVDGLVDIQTP
jgi:hypothetical protein